MGRSGAGGGPSRGGGGGGGRGSMGRSSSSGRSGIRSGLSHSSFHEFSSFSRRTYFPGHRTYHGAGYRSPYRAYSGGNSVYYTDNLFWFGNDKVLLDGMKDFYKKTGVQPHLYITDEVDGSRNPSSTQMETFAEGLYDEMFQDEAHLLLVFQDADGHYTDWVITGAQAKQVVDTEAVNILLDYVDRYYYDTFLDESELFGRAFSKAADRMMSKTVNPLVYVAGAGVAIVVIVAGVYVFRKKQEQKKREDEQMERILNMDLNAGETGVSSEVKDLENKYSTKSGGN